MNSLDNHSNFSSQNNILTTSELSDENQYLLTIATDDMVDVNWNSTGLLWLSGKLLKNYFGMFLVIHGFYGEMGKLSLWYSMFCIPRYTFRALEAYNQIYFEAKSYLYGKHALYCISMRLYWLKHYRKRKNGAWGLFSKKERDRDRMIERDRQQTNELVKKEKKK